MDVVLIPAYEPDAHLIEVTQKLHERGFTVLIVDDGSGEAFADIFAAVQDLATVIAHEKNRGKGAALKTGMRYIRDHMPQCENFITCDADGQHSPEDTARVRQMLHNGHHFVLTVRAFKKDMPLKSKLGNGLSRFVYALLTNRYLSDNQSGLRGFARRHIDWLIEVESNNYDYEMNMLYYAVKKGVRVSTLTIEAIYINNNQASHFNPVKDTLRIYRSLFSLARGTLISFLVSEALVVLVSILFGADYMMLTIPTIGAVAWIVNVVLSKIWVFRTTRCYDYWSSLTYTVISYFIYMLGSMLIVQTWPVVPVWLAFNICYLVGIPLRYFLHRSIYIAAKPKE